MPQNCLPRLLRSPRFLATLLASSCSFTALADTPVANESRTDTSIQLLPVAPRATAERPGTAGGDELTLQPPMNSTLEIRVARRPWLLEKLVGDSDDNGVKMDPPDPPAPVQKEVSKPDPPSMHSEPMRLEGWYPRGEAPVDNEPSTEAEPGTAEAEAAQRDEKSAQMESEPAQVESEPAQMDDAPPQLKQEPAQLDPEPAEAESEPAQPELQPAQPASKAAAQPNQTPANPEDTEDTVEPEPWPAAQSREPLPLRDPSPQTTAQPAEEDDSSSQAKTPETVEVRQLRIDQTGKPLRDFNQTRAVDRPMPEEATEAANPDPRHESANDEQSRVEELEDSDPGNTETADDASHAGDLGSSEVTIERDYTGHEREPIVMTRTMRSMQAMMQQCLRYYFHRPEDANERSNWGVMHSIMVYGADTPITVGAKRYNAIAWIAGNNACRGQRLVIKHGDGITARNGVGLQGHQAQLLAILSLCDVPIDYGLYAGSERYSVLDLVKNEMLACRTGEELTFTLIGLAHYLDTDTVWRNADGETWDFERLLREELSQPIVGAACGGTHRLMGYAHALRKRRAEGKPIEGQWKRAQIYTDEFIAYAYRLQNRDGSMTTDWFEGREDNGNIDRKVQTTGHIVEWLLTVTPDSELHNQRLVASVRFLLKAMYEGRGRQWKIGPKGHALRSLAMFYERAYGVGPAWRAGSVAQRSDDSHR